MTTKVKNGISFEKNGWIYLSINGEPRERGYAHGYLVAKQFKKIQEMLRFFILETYGEVWERLIEEVKKSINFITTSEYPELYEEMLGIAEGCTAAGTKTTIDEIIAWNYYYSIPYWFPFVAPPDKLLTGDGGVGKEGGARDRCSAFIAVGDDWTEDGKIVVSHNSFCDFIDGQYSNVILDINPAKGFRILMQTCPCWIWSGSDFFVTSAGIVGTETTIGGFNRFELKSPIGYRIRTAMQYGNDLPEYATILLANNGGDYANSWLFGNTNTNEIMRLELGLAYNNVETTKNGYFIGFNAPYDPKIRVLECTNSGFYDIRRHQGARKVRLTKLIYQYKGKLNIENAQKIIGDHYDVYLNKDNNPCSRTICSHYDLDPREYMSQIGRPPPFAPHGAVDGMVADTTLIKNMSFMSRWGNSCGTPFIAEEFSKKNIQWSNISAYLIDRPTQEWSLFSTYKKIKSRPLISKKKKNGNHKTKKNAESSKETKT